MSLMKRAPWKTSLIVLAIAGLTAIGLIAQRRELASQPRKIERVVGVKDCGKKYTVFTFVNERGQTQTRQVFHDQTIQDETGAIYRAAGWNESIRCELSALKK